jgi:heme oxygenase
MAMRERTARLHAQAERTGIVAAIQTGRVTRAGYAAYLRNLLPVYRALEQGLPRHRASPGIAYLAQASLCRAARIEADLDGLAGTGWAASVPLLAAGRRYADHVGRVAAENVELLYAHAYTRYLGDLYGGQILRRRLIGRFGLSFGALAFTEFPAIPAIPAFAAGFRAALDEAGRQMADAEPAIEEAAVAFRMNIALSEAVAALESA